MPWPWPWIWSCGIPSCITYRPVCTYQISQKSEKFVSGRTKRRDPSKFKVTWHKNKDKFQKSGRKKFMILCSSLRISGQLPAPSISGGGDRVWKVQFSELHLELGHTAYRHASLIDLYVHTKFHWNRTKFLWTDVWMDGWMDVPTDGRTFPPLMLLSRLRGVDLKRK